MFLKVLILVVSLFLLIFIVKLEFFVGKKIFIYNLVYEKKKNYLFNIFIILEKIIFYFIFVLLLKILNK